MEANWQPRTFLTVKLTPSNHQQVHQKFKQQQKYTRNIKKIQSWITNDLCDKRTVLRKTTRSSVAARGQYQQANREDRKKVRAAKEDWIEVQCKSLKAAWKRGTEKRPTTLKILMKTGQPTAAVIENKDGKRLTDDEDVLKRWTEYCDGIQLPALLRQLHPTRRPETKFIRFT